MNVHYNDPAPKARLEAEIARLFRSTKRAETLAEQLDHEGLRIDLEYLSLWLVQVQDELLRSRPKTRVGAMVTNERLF